MLVESLLSALNEVTIAREVGTAHDNARMAYRPALQRIDSYEAFEDLVGDYVIYHHERCVARGGQLSRAQAIGMGEAMLDQAYRREGGNKLTAFHDVRDSTNGGVRSIFDRLADAFKEEAVEFYMRRVFANHVSPEDWTGRVALMREFLNVYGHLLDPSIDLDSPERYTSKTEEIIRAYISGLRRTSNMFRSS